MVVQCNVRCLLKVPESRHIKERLSDLRVAAHGVVDVEDRHGGVVRRCQHPNACSCDVRRRCRLPALCGTRCRLVEIQNCAGTRCRECAVSVRRCCAKMPAFPTHAAATFGEDPCLEQFPAVHGAVVVHYERRFMKTLQNYMLRYTVPWLFHNQSFQICAQRHTVLMCRLRTAEHLGDASIAMHSDATFGEDAKDVSSSPLMEREATSRPTCSSR